MAIRHAQHANQDIKEAWENIENGTCQYGLSSYDNMPTFEECKNHCDNMDWFYYPSQDDIAYWGASNVRFVKGVPVSLIAETGCFKHGNHVWVPTT